MKRVAGAALVHVFTALGAVCALMAVLAIESRQAEAVFLWLAVAFFIDGIDGTFARAMNVKTVLPRFSGERLDLVVDYLTYVFVPVLALIAWRYLDGISGLILAALILLSSLYHFADEQSKDEDNCFVGFPAIWNLVAFYIFALTPPPAVISAVVMTAIVLTFVPMPWVHPARTQALRIPTFAATAAFCLAGLATLWHGFPAGQLPRAVLLAVAAYGVALALLWWRKRRG